MAAKKDSGGKPAGKKAAVPRVQRTAELAAKICAVIARGCTVSEAAAKCGCSDDFIYDWKREDADFSGKFTRAREDGSQLLEDMLIEVMRQEKNSVGNPDTTAQDVSLLQHVWEQGYKLLQVYNARFKERKAVELTGADGKDLIPAPGLPPEQMNELAVRIAEVREETRRKKMEAAGDE